MATKTRLNLYTDRKRLIEQHFTKSGYQFDILNLNPSLNWISISDLNSTVSFKFLMKIHHRFFIRLNLIIQFYFLIRLKFKSYLNFQIPKLKKKQIRLILQWIEFAFGSCREHNFENCEEEEREREKKRDKFHRLLDSSFEQKILRTRRLVSFRIT